MRHISIGSEQLSNPLNGAQKGPSAPKITWAREPLHARIARLAWAGTMALSVALTAPRAYSGEIPLPGIEAPRVLHQHRGHVPLASATVTLSAGANIQSAINSNPKGTAFSLGPGVYRMQALVPKQGDSFVGQTGADLNGAQVLTNWVKSGSYWTSAGDPALNKPTGPASAFCNDASTGCAYPQDLYLNSAPLVHKLALPITSGQWYFDYTHDVIYMASDPTRQTVELSVAQRAFSGYVNNVTVQNIIVEKYATPLLYGAISPSGSNWTITSNEVRLNHAAGIKPEWTTNNYEQILSNNVHDNGQEGISVGGGTGTLIEYNTISHNNYANVLDGFEEGGGKIYATTNTQVINNTYSNNNGMGLWVDGGATGVILSGNTISGSRMEGIRYEISHYGTISNNVLTNNEQASATSACVPYVREIDVADSDNTSVTGNTINTNCAGIMLSQGNRNRELNDAVTDNTTTYSGLKALSIGGVDSQSYPTLFNPANGNYFDYNIYHFTSSTLNLKNWTWNRTALSWSGWKAAGQDIHGSAD